MQKTRQAKTQKHRLPNLKIGLPVLGGFFALAILAGGFWWQWSSARTPSAAPEADSILAVQASMPFQILIPAYMPQEFERKNVGINVNQIGPGGEPMIELAYTTAGGGTLFVRQWVPINPEKEVLSGARPIETKWGPGWMLKQGEELLVIWVDVGPLRVSIFTAETATVSREIILEMANTLGPASNQQVFSFAVELPEVRQVEPPPPYEVPLAADGVQEFTLVVTPGGYDPLRFAVKKGIPVRMTFKALGSVGCGKELLFTIDPAKTIAVDLASDTDVKTIEYTPTTEGVFGFQCSHQMYRGQMYVLP